MKIEIICTTVQEAIDVEMSGADRIELVTGIAEGGLTPSIALIEEVCDKVDIPVHVMVRPHSKSFVYSNSDKLVMLKDIINIKNTKATGIVIGSLTEEGVIDRNFLDDVIKIKEHLNIAYHRAVDSSNHYIEDMRYLLNQDIDIILTSASKDRIEDGDESFKELVEYSKTKPVVILGGSGINFENAFTISERFNLDQIHIGSAAKIERNNFNEIDVKALTEFIKKIKA